MPKAHDTWSPDDSARYVAAEPSSACAWRNLSVNVPLHVPGASACWAIRCGAIVIGGVNVTAPLNSQLPLKLSGFRCLCLARASATPAMAPKAAAVAAMHATNFVLTSIPLPGVPAH